MSQRLYPRNLPRPGGRERPRPVYLFAGGSEDEYREATERLREIVLAPAFGAFNFGSYDSREVALEEVIAAARTRAMGGGGRLVVFRDVNELCKEDVEKLLAYVRAPETGTCLILVAGKYEWKSTLFKGAEAEGILVDFRPPADAKKSRPIRDILASLRLEADDEALGVLEAVLPDDRGLMRRELEKVDLALGEKRRITAADLKDLVLDRSTAEIYRLADLLARKDRAGVMRVLDRLIEEGEEGIGLVGYLAKQYRLLLAIKEDQDLKELKPLPPSKVLQTLREGAGRFTREELMAALLSLRNIDRYLKSSTVPPAFILEAFFSGMLPGRAAP